MSPSIKFVKGRHGVSKGVSWCFMVFHKIILFDYTYFEANILTGELLLKSITCLHRYILRLVSRIDDDELCAMRECVWRSGVLFRLR